MNKEILKQILAVSAASVFWVNGLGVARAVNLCPSSSPAPGAGILIEYKTPTGVPDTAAAQSTNDLEMVHQPNPSQPIPGMKQKNLVLPNQEFPSCTGIPGQPGSLGYTTTGECDGQLVFRVARDGMSISSGQVTVRFMEVNNNVTQADLTNVFTLWPSCGSTPPHNVPCQASDPNVALFQNLIDVLNGNTRHFVNLLNSATVTITDIQPTEIRSDPSNPIPIPGQNDQFLHLMTGVGTAPPNSQWFAYAVLTNGPTGAACVQVSRLLPYLHHN